MAHDPARVADTRAWLGKSEMDLRAARNGFKATPPLLEDILFPTDQGKVRRGRRVGFRRLKNHDSQG